MQSAIFDTPSIKIESLKTKFDSIFISNSFITLIGDYIEAIFLHQLHYWSYSEYGVVINDVRWIYKPYREWLSEVFTCLTEWKLRVAIASLLEKGLIRREKLFVKHHQQEHNSPWWNPKNQTYYYSVNYDKLQELIEEVENTQKAESIENVRFENDTKLSVEDFSDTKCCELSQNRSKNTSIKNSSKEKSHPTLPKDECEIPVQNNQDKQPFSKPELDSLKTEENKKVDSVPSKAVEKDISCAQVEEKVNQNNSTVPESVQVENVQEPVRATNGSRYPNRQALSATSKDAPSQVEKAVSKPKRSKTPKGNGRQGVEVSSTQRPPKPKRKDKAPWKDEEQFKRFYRALVQDLPIVANSHSPQGLAQTIIRQLRSGIPHSYWDDFIAGTPIGISTMPEWEIEPGVPYPMFVEYLTEKIKKGDNTTSDEQTRNEVFRILSKPRQAKAFWGQFKRSVVNVSEQVERDRALGVSNPSTPVWTRERIEPSVEEAAAAGEKIMAVNDAAITAIKAANNRANLSESSSPTKFLEVPDPWLDEEESQPTASQPATSQPTMRELLTKVLGARNLKGFVKAMPKVSKSEADAEERAEKKPKTHISQMSVAEINDYLADPVLSKQIMPQLWNSDYEFTTNEYGDIIGVRRPKP